jgi:pimeloyl-ACP methyl ester carboxylesterase
VEHLTRDGVELAYVEQGSGDPAIVLLHGMACLHSHMQGLADDLGRDHRCVSFDLRGHGESSAPPGPYTTEAFTADIEFAIDELGLGRPVLIGHSFGGSVALAYAAAHPEHVRALVMLDSGIRAVTTVNADLNPFYDALRAADDDEYRRIVGEFVTSRLFDPLDDPALAAQVADEMAGLPRHVFLSMSETVTAFDSADAARACTVPALIVQAREPFADRAVLAELGDNWHTAQVVGSGHFVQLLVPEQVHPIVRKFLELVERGQAAGISS